MAPGSAPAIMASGKIFRRGGAKAASAKVPAAQSAAKNWQDRADGAGFCRGNGACLFITDFALNLSNKPAVTNPHQVETGSGGQGKDTQQEPQSAEAPVAQQKAAAALWLPERTLRNASALDSFLAAAKQAGASAVMIDAKDTDGTLLFPSALEQVKATGATEGAYSDFAQALQKIHDNGLSVIARVQCFRDPLAARKLARAVRYATSGPARSGWTTARIKAASRGPTPIRKRCGAI